MASPDMGSATVVLSCVPILAPPFHCGWCTFVCGLAACLYLVVVSAGIQNKGLRFSYTVGVVYSIKALVDQAEMC
jgi:hypothetical protein